MQHLKKIVGWVKTGHWEISTDHWVSFQIDQLLLCLKKANQQMYYFKGMKTRKLKMKQKWLFSVYGKRKNTISSQQKQEETETSYETNYSAEAVKLNTLMNQMVAKEI